MTDGRKAAPLSNFITQPPRTHAQSWKQRTFACDLGRRDFRSPVGRGIDADLIAGQIHDCMPVILSLDAYDRWPANTDPDPRDGRGIRFQLEGTDAIKSGCLRGGVTLRRGPEPRSANPQNLARYSPGVIPVERLNNFRKNAASSYPTAALMVCTDRRPPSSISLAIA